MSHVPYTVQTTKAVSRSPCQRSACTAYSQWPATPARCSEARYTARQTRSKKPGARTADQRIRQDDKFLDPPVARRSGTDRPPHTNSPGDVSSHKRIRQAQIPREEVEATSISAPTKPKPHPNLNPGSHVDDNDRNVLPLSEFSAVKETLLGTFRRCSELLFLSVSCALSCVLRSFRPLHKIEIAGAVVLFLASRSVSTSEIACDEDLSVNWLSQCSDVLTEDESGYVSFARTSFRLFLQSYRIEGIDSTHATIATICLLQIEIQTCQKSSAQASSVCAKLWNLASSAIAAYATEFWIQHYRCVQAVRPDLTYTAYRVISSICGEQNRSKIAGGCSPTAFNVSDQALNFCLNNKLDILTQIYAQRVRLETYLAADAGKAHENRSSSDTQLAACPEAQVHSSSTSSVDLTNEAFEQLELDESMYATSSSESDGWTEL